MDTAALLTRAGARVNAANAYGVTPLALACLNGSAAMVGLLLEAGADPNLARGTGETPLMTAARVGAVAVVDALLARGASVEGKEPDQNQTALMWAVSEKHPDIVKHLEAEADKARAELGDAITKRKGSGTREPGHIEITE